MYRIVRIAVMLILSVLAVSAVAAEKKAKKTAKTSKAPFTDPTTGMQFVWVVGGCYMMGDTFGDGSDDQKPVHEVCVDGFYMGKYEVTQGQWEKITGSNPAKFTSCGSDCPVEQVRWVDVQEYIGKLNRESGKHFRLPTEAEWEYAARSGGKQEKWAGTNSESNLGEYAWTSSGLSTTHPVGQKRPNSLGLYDMSGNVWEWVSDRYDYYDDDYYKLRPRNPQGPAGGKKHIDRGGSYFGDATYARTSNRRDHDNPDYYDENVGFRLVSPAVQ